MKKKYEVNWKDIKLLTQDSGNMILCRIEYDDSKYMMYSSKGNYFDYSSMYSAGKGLRSIPKEKFNLEREKELIKSLFVTMDYYNDFILKKEVHSLE